MGARQQKSKVVFQLRSFKLGMESAAALVGTIVSATLLILTAANAGPLWRDEVNTANVAQMPSLHELWQNMRFESFPPLWPLLLRGCGMLGLAGSDIDIRLLGLCVSLSVLGALWLCARWMGCRAPILSIGLLGCLPVFVFTVGANRAYGLATCLLVLSFGTVWRMLEVPSRARIFAAGAACFLYTQCVYYDVVFLAAILTGGAVVVLRRRQWKILGALVVIGAVSVISLAAYLPIIRQGTPYVQLMQFPYFSFSTLWEKLRDAVAARSSSDASQNGLEIWLWIALVSIGSAAALFAQRIRKPALVESGAYAAKINRGADLALFCVVSMLLGVCGLLTFLFRLHYWTETWYYIQMLFLCAISLDGLLGANWPMLRPWGLLRIGFLAAMIVWNGKAGWQEARTRRSNVDLVAAMLNQTAAAGDIIVVQSVWEGITFNRYYHGQGQWETVPPIDSHLVHRNDLMLARMNQTEAMVPVLNDITNALRAGHCVWMVGSMSPVRPGAPPQSSPLAWWYGTHSYYWNAQVTAAILDNALHENVLDVDSGKLVSRLEDLPVIEFTGYRSGGLPAKSDASAIGAAHN